MRNKVENLKKKIRRAQKKFSGQGKIWEGLKKFWKPGKNPGRLRNNPMVGKSCFLEGKILEVRKEVPVNLEKISEKKSSCIPNIFVFLGSLKKFVNVGRKFLELEKFGSYGKIIPEVSKKF